MKRVAYWIVATILLVTLLVAVFSAGNLIAEARWPFAIIWGGFIAGLGLVLIVLARVAPYRLWGLSKSVEPDPGLVRRAVGMATMFGAAIIVGGLLFALTARVGVLIDGVIVAAILLRLIWPPSRDRGDDVSGPAA